MKVIVFFCLLFFVLITTPLQASDGFTQEDRERLIRLEATLETFMKQVDKRFEQVDKRFEEFRGDVNKRFEGVDKRFEQVDKRFEELREDMNKRFEELRADMNKRFEEQLFFMKVLAAIFTSLVVAVIAFAYWDRRTIIRKAREEAIERIEREGRLVDLINALRELAKKNADLARVLRDYKLL